ncbi:MAG: MarC family protein [Flavobacteriales bacterium]
MDHIHPFIHLLFISIIALFPVVNPVGSAFMVDPYLTQLSDTDRKAAAGKITFYAFSVCVFTLFVGHWILQLFGITIPVIQVAGGIMICKMGWESLSTNDNKQAAKKDLEGEASEADGAAVAGRLFYPLTFPITTGAGTISVLFTLSAQGNDNNLRNYLFNTSAILLAIVVMCVLVFVFYRNTRRMVHRLGANGQLVMTRISAFLIFCVGLQIAVGGIKNLVHSGMLS